MTFTSAANFPHICPPNGRPCAVCHWIARREAQLHEVEELIDQLKSSQDERPSVATNIRALEKQRGKMKNEVDSPMRNQLACEKMDGQSEPKARSTPSTPDPSDSR